MIAFKQSAITVMLAIEILMKIIWWIMW